MGAVILPLMGIYFVLLIVATRLGWRFAEKKGWKKRWLGAVLGFLIVYLPVLGDWIPTVLAHKYYCATEAGFWEYKTLDQWKAENPGVFETLHNIKKSYPNQKFNGGRGFIQTYPMNNRFNWIVKREGPFLFNLWQHEQELIDTKTDEVLARYIDFSSGNGSGPYGGEPPLRFWLQEGLCKGDHNDSLMRHFRDKFTGAKK